MLMATAQIILIDPVTSPEVFKPKSQQDASLPIRMLFPLLLLMQMKIKPNFRGKLLRTTTSHPRPQLV
jgi:hypothetical protein